ncbi:MAG: oligoendopeptidase [Clostridiales bacterium]|jgi:oligoendopeptidase F|nr:oligoendopeptidase [Clostridiales bacterium]MDN5283391.1 oligoendopeptidase [Candidatus Ozemobacter sp.]
MTQGTVWNLESYFPEFNGTEMKSFKEKLIADIKSLVRKGESLEPLNADNLSDWENLILEFEEVTTRLSHYSSYIGCLGSADAKNEDYQKASAELAGIGAEYGKIEIHLKMGFKSCEDKDFSAFCELENLKDVAFHLKEIRTAAQKTMAKDLETLASDLSVDGFDSWGRLYDNISGKLSFEMIWPDGRKETLPIAQCRSTMQDTDRNVRKSAMEQGNKAWAAVEDVCAACLNAISGNRLLLNEKRGFKHFLEVPLKQARITQGTLDAMFSAIDESKELVQRLGKAKAKALGLEKLAWYDCEAPLPIPSLGRYTWDECLNMVGSSFDRSYPELGKFFKDALEKKWVESEKRGGKRPGAFCTGSMYTEESRVFMTYVGSLHDVSTLAHEIGHAFHSYNLKGLRPLLKEYPMTLAESASTFGEMLLAEGILSNPTSSDALKLNILTEMINHGIAFLIDIPIRFNFEKSFYEERANGELSVSRFKELMAQTMKNQFGDLLEEGGADEYFWASKMHFYLTEVNFYNFPYSFGYLLSRGLYEMFKQEKEGFLPKYRDFLRFSGSDMAHIVAKKTLGADLEKTDFWKQAIMSHEPELKAFEELVPKVITGR